MGVYSIWTYEPSDDPGKDGSWRDRATVSGLPAVMRVFRQLLAEGYDTVSIAIERVEGVLF